MKTMSEEEVVKRRERMDGVVETIVNSMMIDKSVQSIRNERIVRKNVKKDRREEVKRELKLCRKRSKSIRNSFDVW